MHLSKITPMFLAESEVLLESVPITMGGSNGQGRKLELKNEEL